MALLKFLKGNYSNLSNAAINEGQILICNDTAEMFVDVAADKRIKIGDFTVVGTIAELEALDATKVPTSRLYYVENGNILARSNGTSWVQINKQKTLAELGGVAQSAYDEKVAALEKADSDNADAISGVDTRLQAAEEKLKSVATTEGLGELTDRVTAAEGEIDALQAASHTHTFADTDVEDAISKKHSHTFADADVVDAISKKHAHTFNETELNKIVEGDVAKWNGVVADHLTSDDKTALENSIKEAKKAGTDANTNIETYKVVNDARVLAVEEDIAEITGENGILAQAKTYTDGKDSAMNTRVAALEAAAPTHALKTEVEAVDAKFANYNTTVAQKAIDDAQDAEIAKKVAKTDYEADKATFATKTELGDVDAKFANYKTAADQKLIDDAQDVEIGKKVDKIEGKSLVDDAEITKLAGVSEGANKVEASTNGKIKIDGVDTTVYVHPDKHTVSEISDFETKIASYDYATKTEAQGYADAKDEAIAAAKKAGDDAQKTADDITTYVGTFTASEGVDTVVKYIDAKTANIASDERVNGIDNRVKAIEDDYLKAEHKTALEGLITAEQQRAEGIEGGLRTDVDAIKGDYLKAADKTELEGKITAEETRATGVESGLDARIKAVEDDYLKASDKEALQTQINTIMNNPDAEGAINSINEFTQYVKDHGTIADGFRVDIDKNKEDIAANTKAIGDEAARADAAEKALAGRLDTLEAIDHEAYVAADTALKTELEGKISDGDAATLEAAKKDASDKDAVILSEAQKYADQTKADAIADAATKYETIGTAQGIVDGLKLSETYEPIGAEGRAISAAEGKVNELASNIYTKAEIENLLCWGEF